VMLLILAVVSLPAEVRSIDDFNKEISLVRGDMVEVGVLPSVTGPTDLLRLSADDLLAQLEVRHLFQLARDQGSLTSLSVGGDLGLLDLAHLRLGSRLKLHGLRLLTIEALDLVVGEGVALP